jgi:hypothetical protein
MSWPRARTAPISVVADRLQGMAALSVEVESITSLRCGDQLDQIGAAVPNGLVGQRSAGQQSCARIDSVSGEQRHHLAQAAVITILSARNQPKLLVNSQNPRERAHHLRIKSKGTSTAQASAEHHVQGERASISKADQDEAAGIQAIGAQFAPEQRLEMLRHAIKRQRLDIGGGTERGERVELPKPVEHNERRRGDARCPARRNGG